MHAATTAVAAVFEPVQAVTTFEETVERLGTAIRLGLLGPGAQLPPERDLADQLGISRSTLRQALTALTQSGHLVAVRGRGGGWFVADPLPPPGGRAGRAGRVARAARLPRRGRGRRRRARGRARRARTTSRASARHVEAMHSVEDFATYRQADVFFHLGLAEAAGLRRGSWRR